MLSNLLSFINEIIESIGYFGIFLLMVLESSFFPFPSEIIMIPAGFLASLEKYNLFGVILAGSLGSLIGALFNYYFAKRYGLNFLLKYGKYIGIKQKSIDKMMKFFETHGVFGTFIGRLLPGIKAIYFFTCWYGKITNHEVFILYNFRGIDLGCYFSSNWL